MKSPIAKEIPELNYLLREVEQKYGRRLSTSTDFEALSVVIEREINELLSASTLKRLWGYVTSNPVPRATTLDILSRFLGKRDFISFCNGLKNSPAYESSFFSAKFVPSSSLEKNTTITVGWNPNRVVTLRYLGDFKYRVIKSENSHLEVDDEFELASFILGYPLYIQRILRKGAYTPSYIAGASDGLTVLNIENPSEK